MIWKCSSIGRWRRHWCILSVVTSRPGVYLSGRQDKTSGAGRGASNRERAKQGHIYRVDPAILGQFRIDVTDPDWNQTFYPKANR
jgi:hypothetical protein